MRPAWQRGSRGWTWPLRLRCCPQPCPRCAGSCSTPTRPARTTDAGWTMAGLLAEAGGVGPEVLAAAEEAVTAADPMVIVHTSGSTSEPKGVVHSHGALIRHLDNLNQLRRYDDSEILFSNSPFFWIGGFAYALLGTLVAGATLVCANARVGGGRARRPRTRAPHHGQRVRRVRGPRGPGPDVRLARPVVHTPGQPLPDHAGGGPAGRPRAAPRHARHDRGGERVPGQRRRVRAARDAARARSGAPCPDSTPASSASTTGPSAGRGSGRAALPGPVPHGGLRGPGAPRDLRPPTTGSTPATWSRWTRTGSSTSTAATAT